MNNPAVRMKMVVILVTVSLVLLAGCGGGTNQSPNNQPLPPSGSNPPPSGTIVPTFATVTVAPDPTGKFGKFAYVANFGLQHVSMYTINPTSGTLGAIGTVAAGTSPISVAVDPFGKFAYVANEGSNDISIYTINSTTGALEPQGAVPARTSPVSVAVDPFGKFAYVVNEGSNDVSMYTINTITGTLTPLGPIAAGVVPTSVAVDPSGKFAYVTNADPNGPFEVNSNNGYISVYTIDATTGVLASAGTIPTGRYPRSVAIDHSGKFAFVSNCGDFERNQGDVAMYTINVTTGILTSDGTIDAGSCPLSVALHPSGKFAYAANTGSDGGPDIEGVSMYTINPATGALMSIGLIGAGYCPNSVAVDPSGKFAYVTNSCDNNLSMYSIDAATGALTLIGTIGT